MTTCEWLQENRKNKHNLLIVGNTMDFEVKHGLEKSYGLHIWDVSNLLWLLAEFPQLQSDFVSLLSFNVADILPEKPFPNICETKTPVREKEDFQERLRKIRPGKEDAVKYEKLCEEITRYLFSDNMEFFGGQKKSEEGLYRFDYCGKIKYGNTSEFFDMLKEFFRTKYIVFEFKNYVDEITQKEIYTTEKYLYETALRRVAIIITRKGMDKHAKRAARGSLRESGKLILCLSDEELNQMIDLKIQEKDPGDYLEALLDDMLMALEK